MLKGNLSGFSLGEIFQSLAINKHTGTLSLTPPTPGAWPKHIYFEDGVIRFFSHGEPQTPRIGELLVRTGRLAPQHLEKALKDAAGTGQLLGRVLLDNGYIAERDIQEALAYKLREELYELFSWEEGDFEFRLNECPEELFDALQRSVKVAISTNAVIMEGLRRMDEWQRIHTRIRTENEIFIPTGAPLPESEYPVDEALELSNGRTSVGEIVSIYPGSKFELLKAIYDLLESGTLAPRSVPDLRTEAAEAEKARDFAHAVRVLRFASECSPETPEIFIELGDSLAHLYQEKQAQTAYIRALHLLFDQGDWDVAADVAEKLPPNADVETPDLHRLLRVFIELKLAKKALWAGQQLAAQLQKAGEMHRAVEVLNSLVLVDPDDLNLKIQIATLLQQVGDVEHATQHYEEVAAVLEEQKKVKDQIKILRIVAELNPRRLDVKQKVTALVALQEKLERRRKQRLTLAGASAIFATIAVVVPIAYEVKARELYQHATRMEEISLSTRDFSRARLVYEELLKSYGLSSKADDAKLALERINGIQRSMDDTVKFRVMDEQRKKDEEKLKVEKAVEEKLTAAKVAEDALDLALAHKLYSEAQELSRSAMRVYDIRFPVLIRSRPDRATAVVNGLQIGKTPVIHHYAPGDKVEISLAREGCEPFSIKVDLEKQKELEYQLLRKPVAEVVLPTSFEQSPLDAGVTELLIFPSRDGNVYAYDPTRREIAWKRSLGQFGDRLSDLHIRNGWVYVGTVDNALVCFHAKTGKRKWPAPAARGPVEAAPATSEDLQRVAVANVFGEVWIFDDATGREIGKFATENEIVAAPLFANELLLVGSRDSYVYGYDFTAGRIVFISELRSEIVADPVRYGRDGIFATLDGRVHRIDTTRRTIAWSVRVTDSLIVALESSPERIYAVLASGVVLGLDPDTGLVTKHWTVGASEPGGVVLHREILYIGFQDGRLVAWDLRAEREAWSWQADSAIRTDPLVLNGRLYVACNSGTLQVLDLLE